MADLAQWLSGHGLGAHVPAFAQSHIDFDILADLSDADLATLGLSLGDRKRLHRALKEDPIAPPAEPHSVPAENRQLTVLFVDLVGSTALATRLDPEDFRDVIKEFSQICSQIAQELDGYVAKFLGDGALLYFGYPVAREDDAERAVQAGLRLTASIGRSSVLPDIVMQARVGIATGTVVAGDLMGDGMAERDAVLGETPNLAARLQGAAAPGTVMISDATRRLVRHMFSLENTGLLTLQGIDRPTHGWLVCGETPILNRFEATHDHGLTTLVGRDQELSLLLDRWRQARDGEGQAVLLSGEAGIGKSRLAYALRDAVSAERIVCLRYQCSPQFVNTALRPFVRQIEFAAQIASDDPPERRLAKLEAVLDGASSDPKTLVPLLAPLFSIPPDGLYEPTRISADRSKRLALVAFVDWLVALGRHRPVLMIFEDAHWIDPTSHELMDMIVDRIQMLPVLLIVTHRPEFVPPWAAHSHATSLALNRLGSRPCRDLIGDIAGDAALPVGLVDEILARTDGVPLFVEELTKSVLEAGLSDIGDGSPDHPKRRSTATVPSTLQGSLMARIDRLGAAKEVAQIAAAIGREIDHRVLAAVTGRSDQEMPAALARLIGSELVFQRGVPPDITYVFKHALVQQAAYGTMIRAERRRTHRRIAETLATGFADRPAAEPELLAHHYGEAGDADRAIRYWTLAGESAAGRSAHVEASAHFGAALDLVEKRSPSPDRDRAALDLHIARGVPLIAAQGYASIAVFQNYTSALSLCEALGDTDREFLVRRGLWNCVLDQGDLPRAEALARQLLDQATARQNDVWLTLAHRALGSVLTMSGRCAEALAELNHGIAVHERVQSPLDVHLYGEEPGVICRLYKALALTRMDRPDEAQATLGTALSMAKSLNHPLMCAFALSVGAMIHQLAGDTEAADRLSDEALLLTEQHHMVFWSAHSILIAGWCMMRRGECKTGRAEIERAMAAWKATGARLLIPYQQCVLAEACLACGDLEAGTAAVQQGLAAVAVHREAMLEPDLLRLGGAIEIALGRRGEAEQLLQQAVDSAQRQEIRQQHRLAQAEINRLRNAA